VDLVTQKAFIPYIKNKNVIPIIVSDGPITKEKFKAEIVRGKKKRYRYALIPYTNVGGHGYDDVHHAAHNYISGKVFGIGSDGRLQRIRRVPKVKVAYDLSLQAARFALLITLLTGMALWFKAIMPAISQLIKTFSHR
jgi:hypothetical protein